MNSHPFTFLQFCDFHIGGARGPQVVFLESMIAQVREVCREKNALIQAVFLIGDLAWSGKASEYETFGRHFIEPLRKIPEPRSRSWRALRSSPFRAITTLIAMKLCLSAGRASKSGIRSFSFPNR
jgi:hypothetical protein